MSAVIHHYGCKSKCCCVYHKRSRWECLVIAEEGKDAVGRMGLLVVRIVGRDVGHKDEKNWFIVCTLIGNKTQHLERKVE